ncbi:signal peptidase I [Clostridium hydrogenum]|uniref:signal peptidase I n=1 Tax=Clostridium hydrogenum TaxID=2855764 RepID=UPI001F2A55F0|nr:signal peptidase I [Clostridium hydrogenum]
MEIKDNEKNKNVKKEIAQYVITIGIAIAISLLFRTYVFARANVDGSSMVSTLKNKDVLFVEKISLYTKNIKKGEIVTFNSGDSAHETFVKRVIATAGDEIELNSGKVYLNGKVLKESYLDPNTYTGGESFLHENQSYKIPNGYIFVLGDNRSISKDSRDFGPVSLKALNGHVILRAYPFDKIKTFK